MSQVEVDKIIPQSGTTLTIGDSGDTITVASGATLTGDLNADNLTSGTVPTARISGAYTGITQTGTLTNSGAPVSTFNRTTNDGTIIDLRKDGTTVGLISSLSSIVTRITFDPRTNGASLTGGVNKLSPGNENGATNNTLDLCSSTSAFKDLYLGGCLYVGCTGTANLLDDYEEGTWTPVFEASSSNPTITYDGFTHGVYNKVGNVVFARGFIRTDSVSCGSGFLQLAGFPFNFPSQPYGATVLIQQVFSWGTAPAKTANDSNADTVNLYDSSGGDITTSSLATGSNSNQMTILAVYQI